MKTAIKDNVLHIEIPMPFHALGGDKVWERFTADGQPSKAKATTRLCSLDPDLFAHLGLPVPETAEIAALHLRAPSRDSTRRNNESVLVWLWTELTENAVEGCQILFSGDSNKKQRTGGEDD